VFEKELRRILRCKTQEMTGGGRNIIEILIAHSQVAVCYYDYEIDRASSMLGMTRNGKS
jgi:hypothetical protein